MLITKVQKKSHNHLQDAHYSDDGRLIRRSYRATSPSSNHRSPRDVALLFRVPGEEITGTQRKAHYSETSGISPTPRPHQTVKRLISAGDGEQSVHTLAVLFSPKCVGGRQIRCKIALWRFIPACASELQPDCLCLC